MKVEYITLNIPTTKLRYLQLRVAYNMTAKFQIGVVGQKVISHEYK
jgi:hypothetical protein